MGSILVILGCIQYQNYDKTLPKYINTTTTPAEVFRWLCCCWVLREGEEGENRAMVDNFMEWTEQNHLMPNETSD